MATYRMPTRVLAVAGAAVAGFVGVVVRSGVVDDLAAGGAAHAVASAAQITVRTAKSLLHIGTIVLPKRIAGVPHGDTGMRGFDRAGRRTAASRGTPFLLVNPNGRQTTANTSYALAA